MATGAHASARGLNGGGRTPPVRRVSLEGLRRWARQRRVQNITTLALVVLGPCLAFATFLVMGPLNMGASAPGLRLILLADFVYVLLIAALVLQRVARMVAARRARAIPLHIFDI